MAQRPNHPPQQVKPWVAVPSLSATVPAKVPRRASTTADVAAPLSSTVWTSWGPSPLISGSGTVSGRLAGVAAHPILANTIYVAAAGGGVWKTIDGGTNWTPLTDAQTTLSMGAIAVAATNPNIIYAGTGEANNSVDSNFGRGILVSTDGGASWTLSTGPGGVFSSQRMTTSKIAVDPINPNIAYAAMAHLGWNGGGFGFTGVYRTVDGGLSWTNMTGAVSNNVAWTDVMIDPTSSFLYAAAGTYYGDAANGVYKSINGGATWSLLSGFKNGGSGAGRMAIALSLSNPQVVYAISQSTSTFGLLAVQRSDNGGATVTTLTGVPNFMGSQGWYDLYVAVDPSNSAIAYVAGSAGTNSILRTTNSGVNWTSIANSVAVSPHADHHGAAFDALGRLLDVTDGGILRLESAAPVTWSNLNGNLGTIQFQGIALHPTNADIAIAGSQDNGTEKRNSDGSWTQVEGGDGGFVRWSATPLNCPGSTCSGDGRVYHIAPVGSFGSFNFFRRSDDGGISWLSKTNGLSSTASSFEFYAPFVVDPGNGNRLLTGGNSVLESTNAADNWAPLSATNTAGWTTSDRITAIGLAPSTPNVIYASTGHFGPNFNLFVTTNHGVTWTNRPLPVAAHVTSIQVHPANPAIAYATVEGFTAGGNIFMTTNAGLSWNNISGNFPNQPAWSMQIDTTGNLLYVGAEDGVYSSANGGSTWVRVGTGMPNAQVFDLALNSATNILVAATHGRGAWVIATVATPAATVTNVTSATADGTYGVGASISVSVNFSAPVTVTSFPKLNLNSGGTASYVGGSGTNTLTFGYTPASGQNSADLDEASGSALVLNGGTIKDSGGNDAVLALPAPGAAGSLGANKNIVVDTVAPTVVAYRILFGSQSYNVIGSARTNLPWTTITGIQVTFSKPIASAVATSLSGVAASGVSGVGSNTVTWTVGPLTLASYATKLLASGPNALKDIAGNPIYGGTDFLRLLNVLPGDRSDDGTVASNDMVLVSNGRSVPYNVLNDINGDGVVDTNDILAVRSRIGTHLP